MFNILDFIDSPDIREYNKDIKFTPAEQAILIAHSEETTVEEKLVAWQELVDNYSIEEFGLDSIRINRRFHAKDFRQVVIDNIHIWRELLAATKKKDNVVYQTEFGEREHDGDGRENFFSSFDLAYQSIVQDKQEYLDNSGLKNIETYAFIDRMYLDRGNGDTDRFYFDNKLRMVMMRPAGKWFESENEQEKIDLVEDCYMYVPIPFRAGELVKMQSPFYKTDYGVVPFNQRSKEDDICLNHGGDGSDMVTTLDCYLDWRDEFDFCDDAELLSLRRCAVDELPEKQKVLEKVSLARKGEWDWFSLLMKEY